MTDFVFVTDHPFGGPDLERELVEAAGYSLVYEGDVREPGRLRELAREALGVINCYSLVPREVIEGLERCKIVARYGVGVDTIDLAAAAERGIVVTNVPDYCIDEVSDHAVTLALALVRRVPRLIRSTSAGNWQTTEAKPSHRLSGLTFGLVGFGRIAREVARKAQPFGFRVIASDPVVDDEAMRAAGVEKVELADVLAQSDVVSLHAPLLESTRHMINAGTLATMKPGAVIVNTSRGGLIDTRALHAALEAGTIGGAGLDVLEQEPPAADEPVLSHPDVVVTPHTAFYSEESLVEMRRKCVTQVLKVLAGEQPDYPVR